MLTIYKASAGSGKTFTLAYEYIKALLGVKNREKNTYTLNHPRYNKGGKFEEQRHRSILAITFTNKATEEMKERIVRELSKLNEIPAPGAEEPSLYAANLMDQLHCTRTELAESARAALDSLLYDFHFFNVSTIDSFFQFVMRTFARELDRPGDYEVDIDDKYTIEAGVDQLFDDFNFGVVSENGRVGDWIRDYMIDSVREGRGFNVLNRRSSIHRNMVDFVLQISSESFKAYADSLREYITRSDEDGLLPRYGKSIKERRNRVSQDVEKIAEALFEVLGTHGIGAGDLNNTIYGRLSKYAEGEIPKEGDYKHDLKKTVAIGDVLGDGVEKRSNYLKGAAAKTASAEVFNEIKAIFRAIHREVSLYYVLTRMLQAVRNLGLLAYAWHYVERFRTENRLVVLSDTNDLLSRIIDRSETPFIYERIGMELRNYLIDEFQDTSRMQWQNLKPLVATGVDDKYDSLIIGDEKQSIYRFRNSDSSLLHYSVAHDDFPGQNVVRGRVASENTNYRSAPEVVKFNNSLFTVLAREKGVEGFENVVQGIGQKNSKLTGYISFQAKTKEDDVLEPMCAEMIRQHTEGGYNWRDIVVLVNKNEEGEKVVQYLLENKPEIPVSSDESLKINSSKSVKTILSVLRIIDKLYMADKTTGENTEFPGKAEISFMLTRFEYFFSQGMDVERAMKLALEPNKEVDKHLIDVVGPENTLSGQIDSIIKHRSSTITGLVEVIVAEMIGERERMDDFAYIAAFQDVVIEFNSKMAGDLHSFLRWWDVMSEKLTVPSSATQDAVTVMTIHKSKGLEFDCVFIPFSSWALASRTEKIWVETPDVDGVDNYLKPPVLQIEADELYGDVFASLTGEIEKNQRDQVSDQLNKTYVAYTRAVRELIVYYNPQDKIGKDLVQAFEDATQRNADCTMNLSENFDAETENFTYGEPTKKYAHGERPRSEGLDGEDFDEDLVNSYDVFFRDDTKEITTIDSLAADPANIMAAIEKEVLRGDDETEIADCKPVALVKESQSKDKELEAARRGTLLHNILSYVKRIDDIDRAVDRVGRECRLPMWERAELGAMLHQVMEKNKMKFGKVSDWFERFAKVRNEQSIYDTERDETLRLDRIVEYADGSIDVVDYKFTTNSNHDEHRMQVLAYVNLLKAMGYEKVVGYLWYPVLETVVKV